MLNENKIKMMTKMAIYEKNQGRQMLKNARYYKGDYIALSVLKSTIATTFAYIIVFLMYILCDVENLSQILTVLIMQPWERRWLYIM